MPGDWLQRPSWRDLVAASLAATSADALVQTALPAVREASGAEIAVVVRDGVLVSGSGPGSALLDVSRLDVPEGTGLREIGVPPGWDGVAGAAAQRLPGTIGVLVLGWSSAARDEDAARSGLALLEAGLARIQAQAELSDLATRVDNAQNLANMGDYDWHIATDTNRWSDQLYRIYGYEPQSFDPSYEVFLSNIHPDDRDRIRGIHQHAYATGEPYEMIERIVRPDGDVRYLSSNGQVIMGADGTPERMRGTCIDITDRVLAEQAREHSAALVRDLVESSPDAILVLDRDDTVVQANGKATDLLGGDPVGHRIGEVVDAGLSPGTGVSAHRFDGSTITLDATTARLADSDGDGVVAVFLHDASQRLAGEALAARLGEEQLRRRQALELNDNVVQGLTAAAMSLESGQTEESAAYLQRTLASARKMMDDLLEPLEGQRIEAGDLVRQAPSTLEVPRSDEAAAPEPAETASDGHRVLLVDDADDIRLLLRMKLETMPGYEVVGEAADGAAGVDQARSLQPHLVLLDLAMPRMDGLEALPLIREAAPSTRVIVLSGFNQETLAAKALAAGADRYLVKGCSMAELAQTIQEVLAA